jgi:phage tail tube protein FII
MGKLEEKQRMVARDLEQDQAEIKRKTQIVDRNIKKKNQDIFELNEDLAQLQAEQDVRNKAADNYQTLVQTLEKLYSQFSTTVQQRVELEQEYDSLQKAKVQEIETQFQTMGSERADKVELQMTVAKLQAELSLARAKKEALEQESAVLKERLTKLKSDEALCIDDNHIWKSKQHVASTLEEVGHRSADEIETAKTEFQGALTLVHNLNEVLTQRTHQTSDLLDEAKNNLALKVHRLEGRAIYRTRTRN